MTGAMRAVRDWAFDTPAYLVGTRAVVLHAPVASQSTANLGRQALLVLGTRCVLADETVDCFAEQVGVPDVTRVLLVQVDEDPAQVQRIAMLHEIRGLAQITGLE
jgi:hypothetical protein